MVKSRDDVAKIGLISLDPIYHSINYFFFFGIRVVVMVQLWCANLEENDINLLGETQALCKYKKWSPLNDPYCNFKDHELIMCTHFPPLFHMLPDQTYRITV